MVRDPGLVTFWMYVRLGRRKDEWQCMNQETFWIGDIGEMASLG